MAEGDKPYIETEASIANSPAPHLELHLPRSAGLRNIFQKSVLRDDDAQDFIKRHTHLLSPAEALEIHPASEILMQPARLVNDIIQVIRFPQIAALTIHWNESESNSMPLYEPPNIDIRTVQSGPALDGFKITNPLIKGRKEPSSYTVVLDANYQPGPFQADTFLAPDAFAVLDNYMRMQAITNPAIWRDIFKFYPPDDNKIAYMHENFAIRTLNVIQDALSIKSRGV